MERRLRDQEEQAALAERALDTERRERAALERRQRDMEQQLAALSRTGAAQQGELVLQSTVLDYELGVKCVQMRRVAQLEGDLQQVDQEQQTQRQQLGLLGCRQQQQGQQLHQQLAALQLQSQQLQRNQQQFQQQQLQGQLQGQFQQISWMSTGKASPQRPL